jgi:hypothetical protein
MANSNWNGWSYDQRSVLEERQRIDRQNQEARAQRSNLLGSNSTQVQDEIIVEIPTRLTATEASQLINQFTGRWIQAYTTDDVNSQNSIWDKIVNTATKPEKKSRFKAFKIDKDGFKEVN